TGIDPVIAETYFETLKYLGGATAYYGTDSLPSNQVGSMLPGNIDYETPITETCQKNYIIVVSNGLSRYDYLSADKRASLPGFDVGQCNTDAYTPGITNKDAFNSDGSTIDNCLDEMAGWALTHDIATRADTPSHEGDQNVTTYTVGFAFPPIASQELLDGEKLLRDTAEKGGGRFIQADDEQDLVRALNELVSEILKINSTFSSPAVSVNAFNRATNLEDLYFTLFKPTTGEHWEGNLKKFKLEFDANRLPFIADANHNPAIDSATGFFKDASQSYWTAAADAPDGAETALGGAASKIALPRKIYTNTGAYSGTTGVLTPSDGSLSSAANSLSPTNAGITDILLGGVATKPNFILLGVFSIPYKNAMLFWAGGYDFKDSDGDGNPFEARREMGDPLHAEPALVQYGLTAGGEPDLVSYVATNDGYLHAFDTITGKENFAFVPQEMLPKLQNIFDDTGINGKAYGLDGNVVPWINDANKDGTISGAGEHIYLYFGMRRGGRYLYSMDVTDRAAPKLRWVIEGGTGDYAELGQTWSAPNVERIKMGGTERTVLIFGAGYDTNQDALITRGIDSVGRGIMIVDADSGELLWRAGPDGAADLQLTDMKYSIPARIKPIDIDGDGYVDRLFAGDMGGQLWRIDINNKASTATTISVTGGRIADLAVDGSINDNRRFYNPPDAALIVEEGRAPYVAIIAASGYRAHPLQTNTHDRVYMMRDYDVYEIPASYITVTEADLFDTTANIIGQGTQIQIDAAKASLNGAKGWYITFSEINGSFVGEKALSEPLILNGVAVFTTFIPASAGLTSDICKANDGTGAIYFVNVVDGTPTDDNSGDGTKTREDRRVLLARGGIPPTPRVIITSDGIPTLCVGTECSKAGEVGTVQKMYWYEVEE
ncbi:MAG: PilC/PilY family type IV pilus protein, partial [Gammaproteobacteria bacterium]|nr:PilC/PilY family type IV pilus protein [Gammaproteobacteria bacterium]